MSELGQTLPSPDIAEDIKALQLDSSAEDNVTAAVEDGKPDAVEDGKPDAVEDGKPDAVVSSDKTDLGLTVESHTNSKAVQVEPEDIKDGNFLVHMADKRASQLMKLEKLFNNVKVLDEILDNVVANRVPDQTETVPHIVELPIGQRAKQTAIQDYLHILNTANKEQLEDTKGIEVKIANLILEHREICPQPFRTLEDLGRIGLSEKQGKDMLIKWIEGLFD